MYHPVRRYPFSRWWKLWGKKIADYGHIEACRSEREGLRAKTTARYKKTPAGRPHDAAAADDDGDVIARRRFHLRGPPFSRSIARIDLVKPCQEQRRRLCLFTCLRTIWQKFQFASFPYGRCYIIL